jgi:hypothetical protein
MRCGRWRLVPLALVAAALVCCNEKKQHGREATDARGPEQAAAAEPAVKSWAPSQGSACPQFSPGERLGRVEADRLSEASGLVVSRRDPQLLWSHNDSGGRPRLFALTRSGKDLGSYLLKGAESADWEDIALGPGPAPGRWWLYVGDIGANDAQRDHAVVYRVLEPEVAPDQKPKKRKIKKVVGFRLRYPDRVYRDAETLMVDPHTADLYLVTKTSGPECEVYLGRAPLEQGGSNVLERVATLRISVGGSISPALTTAGDIAADGSAILVRTPRDAFLWPRQRGETVARALERQPCRVALRAEPHGEAIAFAPGGEGFFTVSEGVHSPIYFFERLP